MRKILKILFGLFILGVIINVISEMNLPGSSTPSKPSNGTSSASSRENILRKLSIENWKWHKGGFENIMVADFVFKNDNDFPVKDLAVECIHSAPSGTKIDQNTRTIYEVIPAHGTKKILKFNMGFIYSQAEQSSCHIKEYQLL
jgi:hypothetical protein